MIFVTSSRKPSLDVLKLAKEIAFTLDLKYIPRGKNGLYALNSGNNTIIFILGAKYGNKIFEVTVSGKIVFSMLITNVTITERVGLIYHGFIVKDQTLYEKLSQYINVKLDPSLPEQITFCGTQKRKYCLWVKI